MKLLVGLGNPGQEYRLTRHNLGFMVIDTISRQHGLPLDTLKYCSYLGRGTLGGKNVILAKPLTYMNLSGQAVKALLDWSDLTPGDLLVIHDDLDLEPGRLRFRARGGSGGHRGLQSIIERLGTGEFNRLKIGVGRPEGAGDTVNHVLGQFTPGEVPFIQQAVKDAVRAIGVFLEEGMEQAMGRFNKSQKAGDGKQEPGDRDQGKPPG